MNKLESELKYKLDTNIDKTPSLIMDQRIECLIVAKTKSKEQPLRLQVKYPWAFAASLFIGILLYSSIKDKPKGLQKAFALSFQLETELRELRSGPLQPVIFLEVNKLNQEIAVLDAQLQKLLAISTDSEKALSLLTQRIQKLKSLKELYNTDILAYRI